MNDQISQIPLDIIDDPAAPMRSNMNDEKLTELSASIQAQGLIQPISLRKVGERYEVIAGHRRFKAARLAGLVFVPAIVRELDEKQTDSMRMHENLYREDINPVDEGRYIRKMIDVHGMGPDELSKATGKSEAYLHSRYELLNFPDYLLQAVEIGALGLTAAHWLYKITEDNVRREYTRFAMAGGITAKRAQAWFQSWELGSLPREATLYQPPPEAPHVEPSKIFMPCVLCRTSDDVMNMEMHYGHRDCAKAASEMHSRAQ